MSPSDLVSLLRSRLQRSPATVATDDVRTVVVAFNDGDPVCTLCFEPEPRVVENEPAPARACWVRLTGSDFERLLRDRCNVQQLLFSGHLEADGELLWLRELNKLGGCLDA